MVMQSICFQFSCIIHICLVTTVIDLLDIPTPPGPMMGDDPHFSIALPGGKLLCYTVQGEHGFTFNLISNEKVFMNALFVPDSRRDEVTWLGSMGIIATNRYRKSNSTALRFEALEKKIYINDKVVLQPRNVEMLTFSNGKLTISEATPVEGFKYPKVYVNLRDVGLSFSIQFLAEHLDLFWHSTGQQTENSHGIIGKLPDRCNIFFCIEHNITPVLFLIYRPVLPQGS